MLTAITLSLITAPINADQEVNLVVGRNVAPSAKIRVYINTKNVRTVPIKIYRLPIEDLRHMLDPKPVYPKNTGRLVRTLSVDVGGKQKILDAPQDTYYQRQVNIPDLSPGYYLVESPGYKGNRWATMNVTNLSIVVKRGERQALTWVTDAGTGAVVPNASVIAFRKGQTEGKTTTDKDGIAKLSMPPGEDVMLVHRGTDAAVVGVVGSTRDGEVVSHMNFDRPVYRPGQQGFFKAILRRIKGLGYDPIGNQKVLVEVLDPQQTLIQSNELKTTPIGTVAGDFDIPKEGALGFYTVRVSQGKDVLSLQSFQVAEYRKPEFKATSSFSQKRYLSGEPVQMTLNTEYYFGAKVPNAQVQVTVRRSPNYWGMDNYSYDDGNLYESDTYRAGEVLLNDIRPTDSAGKLVVEVPTKNNPIDSVYSFELTITDGANRQIKHSNSVPVFAAGVRVSANPKVSYVPLGRLIPIEVQLADLDGAPVGGNVQLELLQSVWSEAEKRSIEKVIESTTVVVPKSGKVTASLPSKSSGYLGIRAIAKDSGGRVTKSRSGIYVANPFSPPETTRSEPSVSVRLEKHEYIVGDTVTGFVETNRPGRPILLTMEGADLLSYQVLPKAGPFSFKLNAASAPNMEFNVSQWVKGNRIASGTEVEVVDPAKRITVALVPNHQEYSPGDKAQYKVTTRDSKGNPVGAEVAVQVVDDSIYAVQADSTPALVHTFWGNRPNGVMTAGSAPEDLSGGAYQMQKNLGKDAPMRTQFVDTAFWNAFVQTGPSGEANVEFDMPGNLTAWKAQARAVTGATQVGEATAMTKSSRPLTVRFATPRQMVVGDRLSMVATVTNRTIRAEDVAVKVTVNGAEREFKVKAPASGDAKVIVPIEAKDLGSMKLRGELINSSGTRLDGLEVGVPVLPNGVPFRSVISGRTNGQAVVARLSETRIPGSEKVKLRLLPGPASLVPAIEDNLLQSGRYSPVISAEQVEVAALRGYDWTKPDIREPIAMLGRTHQPAGWAWWDEGTPDPVITARVLRGLMATKKYPQWASLRESALHAAEEQYKNIQFAEYRAHLVEALALAGSPSAKSWVKEVQESKTAISPTAQLALAHALLLTGNEDAARERVRRLTALVSKGTTSFLPVGHGLGWTGSELEANARLLDLLLTLEPNDSVIDGMAQWLADQCTEYVGPGDASSVLAALRHFSSAKPSPTRVGNIKVKVDGQYVSVYRQPEGRWAEADLPGSMLGKPITVEGIEPGQQLRYAIEVRAYKYASDEDSHGIRTMFRWEVTNEAGAWEELRRDIRPNEPIRVSTLVWGDSVTDVVRLSVPIPAGFEFIDQDRLADARSEVRDGAVLYFCQLHDGLPQTFRFYLRAESDGSISVPAAMADALRRADVRGNSNALRVTVRGK